MICSKCNLVQLKHTVNKNFLYSKDYGYRSGTNLTMNSHLKNLVKDISNKVNIDNDDFVLDIGCNDGTLLSFIENQ